MIEYLLILFPGGHGELLIFLIYLIFFIDIDIFCQNYLKLCGKKMSHSER